MKNTFPGFGWSKINRRDIKYQNDVFPLFSNRVNQNYNGVFGNWKGGGEERGGEGKGMITILFGY